MAVHQEETAALLDRELLPVLSTKLNEVAYMRLTTMLQRVASGVLRHMTRSRTPTLMLFSFFRIKSCELFRGPS